MKAPLIFATLLAGLVPVAFGAPTISVTGSSNASQLANDLAGAGISITGAPSYVGNSNAVAQQSGLFSNGAAAGLGIDRGVLLTTGSVQNAVGPNNLDNATYAWNSPGTPSLDHLAGDRTFDPAILSFNFLAAYDGTLTFNYIFGSEEYDEYVGQYNDVFAFLLDGTNIAVLPGGNATVSINNVNLHNNPGYYRENAGSAAANVQYDGLTATFAALQPISAGQHSIVLEIADAVDDQWDSGVFIQAGSLTVIPSDPPPLLNIDQVQGPPVSAPDAGVTAALLAAGFATLALLRRRVGPLRPNSG